MRNLTGKTLAPFTEVSPGHWCNSYYSVTLEDIQTEWGRVTHMQVMNDHGGDVPFADKQLIKNTLAGADKLAIEVYPPGEPITFNVYHLWVLHDMAVPFGVEG